MLAKEECSWLHYEGGVNELKLRLGLVAVTLLDLHPRYTSSDVDNSHLFYCKTSKSEEKLKGGLNLAHGN